MTFEPGWAKRELDRVAREIATWPAWMRPRKSQKQNVETPSKTRDERRGAESNCSSSQPTDSRSTSPERWRHTAQQDVAEFHRAFEIPVGDSPELQDAEFRAALILEEAIETVEAMTGWRVSRVLWKPEREEPDLAQSIDGICDLIYVAYGAAVTFGVDLRPFWDEVHRSNMAKTGGPRRPDGKILKPQGWSPPDIAGILAEELERADRLENLAWDRMPMYYEGEEEEL